MHTDFDKYATKHMGINPMAYNAYSKHINAMMNPMAMTPMIVEERNMNVALMSVFDRLMAERIIFLGLPIDDMVANVINAQLLYLESVDKEKGISIYINSPGGSVYAGLGVYDVMHHISPKIATVNTGLAASMAFVLMIAGEKGQRTSLPHARFMQHQPMGGAEGQASDIQIVANEINKVKNELNVLISKHTGQDVEKVKLDSDRDYWMMASEAKEYGCIDKVLPPKIKK
jgi:ATP-dependent Clp protease protease subunit